MLSGNISLRLGYYAANLPWSYNTKLYLVLQLHEPTKNQIIQNFEFRQISQNTKRNI